MYVLVLLYAVAGDSCFCPESCLASSHYCINSKGGTGITFRKSPNPLTNQCDDCMDGFVGISCDQCTTNAQCQQGEACLTSATLHSRQTGHQQCKLDDSDLKGLLGGEDADVGGAIQINWDKGSKWSDGRDNGKMHFQFFKIVTEANYWSPFFDCSAVNCKMTTSIRKNGESRLHRAIHRAAYGTGPPPAPDPSGEDDSGASMYTSKELSVRSAVIGGFIGLEALLLIAAGFIKDAPLKRRAVGYLTALLSVTLLCLIISNTVDMQKQERAIKGTDKQTNGTYVEVTYRCENPECACSPPDKNPLAGVGSECHNTPFSNVLKGLKDPVYITCENDTNGVYSELFDPSHNPCIFRGEGLLGGKPILLECGTTQCSDNFDEIAFLASKPHKESYEVIVSTVVVCLLGVAVVLHFIYSSAKSRKYMGKWRQTYLTAGEAELAEVSALHALQETGPAAPSNNGIRLSARLLSYVIGSGRGAKKILNKISFEVPPGETLALMGPSGAGKTTLLDLLAARDKSGVTTGTVLVNNETVVGGSFRQKDLYKNMIGYVSQDDTLIPSLTVMECIMYSARLRLPAGMPDEVKKAKAEEIVNALGLSHCKDTRVGGPRQRGISGGEKRRVSIGMELVANPRVLFLDEPTSGLDSYNAFIVMKTIANLKNLGCSTQYAAFFDYQPAIVFSIHQPSKEIFDTFDNLLLLSEGHLLYCGPASTVLDTCSRLGYKPPPSVTNPSDYLLRIASTLSVQERRMLASAAIAKMGTSSGLDDDMLHMIDMSMSDTSSVGSDRQLLINDSMNSVPIEGRATSDRSPLQAAKENKVYYPNFYQELSVVCGRGYQALIGSYYLVLCHIVVTLMLTLLLIRFYSRQPLTLPGVLNRAGSLSFTMLLLGFSSLSALELFLTERDVYVRERNNGYYGSLSYFLSKIVFDIIPLRVFPPLILGSLTYNQMGMRTDSPEHFLLFLGVLVLFNIITAGISFFAATVSSSFGSGVLYAALKMLVFFAFNPLIVQGDTLSPYISWCRFGSPFFLALEVLLVNELKGQDCTFAPQSASGEPSDHPIPIACEQYLQNLSLDLNRVNLDISLLIMWAFFYLIISWIGLYFVRERR